MGFIERISRRLYINAIYRQLARDMRLGAVVMDPPRDLYQIVEREVTAVADSVFAYAEWQKEEVAILTDRLTRRYDVGMAMNEATQRAMKARAEAQIDEAPIRELTANQRKALAFQEQYLKRVQGNP